MSKILYFDCFSGISGDMVLGAFLDAGLPLEDLKRALGSLAVPGFDIRAARVLRAGVSATKFIVSEHNEAGSLPVEHAGASNHHHHAHETGHHHEAHHHNEQGHHHESQHQHDAANHSHGHPHRSLPEIFTLIDGSALSSAGRDRAKAMFQRLGEAEAAIHQMPVDEVHLHEVGALDSIVDVVGAVFALEWAGAERVVCSPLNVGGGMVLSAHGTFPVPAPATLRLLGDAPIYSGAVQAELVTPTGALIATSYASAFGPIPAMSVERVGYGAGDREHPGTPNVLRVLVGQDAARADIERVAVIECEIDDMNPQLFGVTMDRLYAAGALDVFYVPVQMKKNRPGTWLIALAPPGLRQAIADVIFQQTTTIGVRYYEVDRECLRRELVTVETSIGPVRFKVAWRAGRIVNAAPEFDDCVRLADASGLSVKEVHALAVQTYGARHPLESRS